MILFADAQGITAGVLLSVAVSALVSFGVNAYMNRGHNERMVYGQVQKMIEFAVAYPYLESDQFAAQFPNIPNDPDQEKQLRYEYYCCHLFNTLQHVFKLCEMDTECMSDYVYPDELIVRHRVWWRSDPHNAAAYSEPFRAFVDRILRKHGV